MFELQGLLLHVHFILLVDYCHIANELRKGLSTSRSFILQQTDY